jgi:hypothetical protein
MKSSGRFLLFGLLLVALTTWCKFQFGADIAFSGFSPVIAIALFSGMIFRRRNYSFLLPLAALLVSDLVIHVLYLNNEFAYAGIYPGQWKVYLMLLAATMIGWLLKGRNYGSILLGALAAPTAFYLISNFGVWLGSEGVLYSKDFSGLIQCYIAAIPFYKNALIGSLLFLPSILLMYNFLMYRKLDLKLV